MGSEPSRYFQISTTKQKQIPVPRKTFPIQHPGQSLPPRPPSSPAPARLWCLCEEEEGASVSLAGGFPAEVLVEPAFPLDSPVLPVNPFDWNVRRV